MPVVIELLRLQTVRPFIMVIDTGSTPDHLEQVERLRAPDVEVHCLRFAPLLHSSDPVAIAQDLAFSRIQTPYAFCTHSDCFLMRRDLLAYMIELCRTRSPAVGYQISPRQYRGWETELGHTCLMVDVGVMDQHRIGWSQSRYCRLIGRPHTAPDPARYPNDPDTEKQFNWGLKHAGITPYIMGTEANYEFNRNPDFDHVRSFTSAKAYSPNHFAKTAPWMVEALADARARIEKWRAEAKT
jgi:hypothetical protein